MATPIRVRETLQRDIVVSDHNRNLAKRVVTAYLIKRGALYMVGEAVGTSAGVPFVIPMDLSIPPPGRYVLEIADENGKILYPQDETIQEIEVVNAQFNDFDD